MLAKSYPYYLGNRPEMPNGDLEVADKFTLEVATRVPLADAAAIDRAIGLAAGAAEAMRALPAYARQEVLAHCVRRFTERSDELAMALCIEAGKPIKDARGEVGRLIDTFRIAAEESVRIYGEVMPLDISERSRVYTGMWKRAPIRPCSFISPFNFPLNLAAHKVAPAIAAGCPFVLKPASLTPVGALIIGEVLAETNLPPGAFSMLPARREGADLFAADERLKLLSFTGSPEVGWALKARAGKKAVVLELGGNAAVIVDRDADLDDAVERTKTLKMGDPKDPETFIGPMISAKEAERLDGWIQAALASGATLLCGGKREGAKFEATLLEDVDPNQDVVCREAFGPVAVLAQFSDFEAALDTVNDSVYGLQAGIFTRDRYKAQRAWDVLEVGGVVIGDVPSWRVDHMPYSGVKDSGLGREGIRFAIEDMTEIRMMVVRTPA